MPPSHYDESVFINCPFDAEYQKLFRAILFAVQDCGFRARCALEQDDGSETRIEKIYRIIAECKFGIHDISRTALDRRYKLPRFNMPLELGIFLGAKKYGSLRQQAKQCLILDKTRYRYQRFCSDIAGQDVNEHRNSPKVAIQVVRNWLSTTVPGTLRPDGSLIYKRYQTFQQELPIHCESLQLNPDELIFNDFSTLVEEWLRINSWLP